MEREHSFSCIADQEAMGLHDLSKAQVYQKPKSMTELKKKAIDFIRKTKCNPKDRPDEQIEILHEEELESLIGFATEVTQELQMPCNSCHLPLPQTLIDENKKLREELEEWKAEWQEQVQKANDEGYARTKLQIENGKLLEQIEKLKCCNNCKYKNINWSFQPICTVRKNDDRDIENPIAFKCKKWELAE